MTPDLRHGDCLKPAPIPIPLPLPEPRAKPHKLTIPGKPRGRPARLGPLPAEPVVVEPKVPDAGPQLVCQYKAQRHDVAAKVIVRPDSVEGRGAAYWRELLPEEAKGAQLSVVLWLDGWGRGEKGDRHAIALDGDDDAPPVAGSLPDRVPLRLPDGTRCWAYLDAARDEYRPHLPLGMELVQARPPVERSASGAAFLARAEARARRAAAAREGCAVAGDSSQL